MNHLIKIHPNVPPDERTPAIKGHFCLEAEVSLKGRDRCNSYSYSNEMQQET